MKKIINKLTTELTHLQKTVQKESTDILKKLKKLHLKENIEGKRKDLEKLIERKYKAFLPTYNRFAGELRKIAKNAGIDIDKWEKGLQQTTGVVKKRIQKNKVKIAQSKDRIAKQLKNFTNEKPKKKVSKKKPAPAAKKPTTVRKPSRPASANPRGAGASASQNESKS